MKDLQIAQIMLIVTLAGWGFNEYQSKNYWKGSAKQWMEIAEQRTALLKKTTEALEEANSNTVKAIAVIDKASAQLERCRVRLTEGK